MLMECLVSKLRLINLNLANLEYFLEYHMNETLRETIKGT